MRFQPGMSILQEYSNFLAGYSKPRTHAREIFEPLSKFNFSLAQKSFIMKTFPFLITCSSALLVLACGQNTDLASPALNWREPQNGLPTLESSFSRGFGINNAGALVGSARNEDGISVAFKITQNDIWFSDEEVAPNGLPEAKFSVNDRGDVAGHKLVPGGIAPVVWINDVRHDLEILPGYQFAEVFDINASGLMVGECLNGNWLAPTAMRAAVFSLDEAPVDLGTLGGAKAVASGVNDAGDIVGAAENSLGQFRAFLYSDGVMQDLGTLGGTISNANAINNNGEIVGRSLLANNASRAFYYHEGVMTDLGTLGGAASVAFDINDHGEIVGFARIANGQARAFLYKDGVMHDLGALGGIDSRAISINNRGDIIGYYTLPDNSVHAFLYRDGVMMPL